MNPVECADHEGFDEYGGDLKDTAVVDIMYIIADSLIPDVDIRIQFWRAFWPWVPWSGHSVF